jgi:serine/threonine protein kinase
VYSLGAILYTLLTGKVPYDEGSAMRTILRVITGEPAPAIRSLRPDVPTRLDKIVMKCLERQISDRYPTAQALAEELKRFRTTFSTKGTLSLRNSFPSVLLTNEQGKKVRLYRKATILGRAQECDMVLKGSDVSKRHCRISIGEETVQVEDLGSVNGTYVNGRAIERTHLKDGDELDIAGQVFLVKVDRPG